MQPHEAKPQTGTANIIKPTLLLHFLFQQVWMEIWVLKNGREGIRGGHRDAPRAGAPLEKG